MIMVIANHLPDAVRGRMKLWFIEPKPNVFVSGIKDSLADEVVDYLLQSCPASSGMLIMKSQKKAPGYSLYCLGTPSKKMVSINGLQLIVESLQTTRNVG